MSNRLTELIEDILDGNGNADDFNDLIEDLEEDGSYPEVKENLEEMKVNLMNGADRQTAMILLETVSLLHNRHGLGESDQEFDQEL